MATRWYNGKNTELKELAVQTYPELVKKELPKTYEELGHLITSFATNEQVLAVDAMRKLSQLLAVYNDDEKTASAYFIKFYEDGEPYVFNMFVNQQIQSFLSFKDKETAELFLKNFKDLIITAKHLL